MSKKKYDLEWSDFEKERKQEEILDYILLGTVSIAFVFVIIGLLAVLV